jgi:hypothetical protein
MTNDYYIEATLTLFTPEEAKVSRRFPPTPVRRGYKAAHFCVDGTDWPEWVAVFHPVDKDVIQPGDSGTVFIDLLNAAFPRDSLYVGQKWRLAFAGYLVGYGTITDIRNIDARYREVLRIGPV